MRVVNSSSKPIITTDIILLNLLLTTYYLLFITHYSLLTTHYSLLPAHYLLLTGKQTAVQLVEVEEFVQTEMVTTSLTLQQTAEEVDIDSMRDRLATLYGIPLSSIRCPCYLLILTSYFLLLTTYYLLLTTLVDQFLGERRERRARADDSRLCWDERGLDRAGSPRSG